MLYWSLFISKFLEGFSAPEHQLGDDSAKHLGISIIVHLPLLYFLFQMAHSSFRRFQLDL